MRDDFRKRLVLLMDEKRFTIRRAASCAAVSTSTIQGWRSGHQPTNYEAVRKLAEALGVSFSFLLTGREDLANEQKGISVTACFSGEEVIFDGFARITIHRMLPRH